MSSFVKNFLYNSKNTLKVFQRNASGNLKDHSAISNIYLRDEPTSGEVVIKGWVKNMRKLKEIVFMDITDGSCSHRLQVLIPSTEKPINLTTGSSIVAKGVLSKTHKGQLELIANSVNVIGECVVSDGYPLAPRKAYAPEYLRQFLHLRPRTHKLAALLRIRNTATKATHDYFQNEGYIHINTPILTSNDCEGAGEVFRVQPDNKALLAEMKKDNRELDEAYFNAKSYLTVSGQLHLEAAAHGMSRVYTFGPTFRAENSKSRLHLSEFYMVEAETAFITKLEDIVKIVEKLIKDVGNIVVNKHINDIETIKECETFDFKWLEKEFIVLSYDEALHILHNNSDQLKTGVRRGEGLSKEHETFLVKHCGGQMVFVTNWPQELKPFYMKECNFDSSKVAALDLLAPNIGEILGGSLREDDYEALVAKIPENRQNELNWYLDLRKFGGVPTGGFGLGFERFLQVITGINNIKDTIPFPRWPHNCTL